jgi:hypothetical protein
MGKQRPIEHVNDMRRPELPYSAKQLVTVTIPPLAENSILVAGFDHFDGSLRILDVGALRELEVLAERVHSTGKLDTRDTVTATIAAASAVGTTATATITVPAGEVWFIHAIVVHVPAQTVGDIVTANFRISRWPDTATTPNTAGLAFWAANVGVGVAADFEADFGELPAAFIALGDAIGTYLRLEGGDVITLNSVLTGVAAAGALATTLTPYGYKGKLLIS